MYLTARYLWARKWDLCIYFYDSNSNSGISSLLLWEEATNSSHLIRPFKLNVQHCFIPTFAMHCSLVFVCELGFILGVRKGRVLKKNVVNFPLYSLHSLKTVIIPFSFTVSPLFVQTCRDWICLWCSLLPSPPIVCYAVLMYTGLLSVKMILQSYAICWYSFCSRK